MSLFDTSADRTARARSWYNPDTVDSVDPCQSLIPAAQPADL